MAGPVDSVPLVARKRTERLLVTRVAGGARTRRPDELIVEEPLTIQLDGTLVATTMRTPGHDFELAVGFCVTDGLLAGVPVTGVRYCQLDAAAEGAGAPGVPGRGFASERRDRQLDAAAEGAGAPGVPGRGFASERRDRQLDAAAEGAGAPGVPGRGRRASALETDFNLVTVETGGRAPTPAGRLGPTSSSCGWCGHDQLDELLTRLHRLPPSEPIPEEVLATIPDRVLDGQGLFSSTGAVHAAAAFDRDGEVMLTREDVGRHNAVDKVVGALALAGNLPAAGCGLFVSGRASVEMVQKAWAAGFAALVAVSAPTALAVRAARTAGMALLGFVRDDGYNVY